MSFNKIKSLKLQRHNESTIKQQDTLMMLAEEMKTQPERMEKPLSQNRVKHQESLTPLHSTPKRSLDQSCSVNDRQDYQISPMMLPCTQEVANEVAWDWQSPLTKTRETRRRINNGESISTPKRTNMLKKKRNSNSPLLYNPIKRKLLRSENQQESIEKFTAEMKALSEQIKTVPRENEIRDSRLEEKTVNETDDELLIQIDIEDFVECENRSHATSIVDNAQKNMEIRRHSKTSMDDLFDDSIEDSMVKCSQEVEEKLRLESYHDNATRTNSAGSCAPRTNLAGSSATRANSAGSGATTVKDFSWHQQSYANCLTSKEKSQQAVPGKFPNENNGTNMKNSASSLSSLRSTTDSGRSGNTVATLKTSCLSNKPPTNESHKSSNAITNTTMTSRSTNLTNKVTSTIVKSQNDKLPVSRDNELFIIPDDSFDDDFLDVCFDDVEDKTSEKVEKNQSPQRYGKVYKSPHSTIPKHSRRNVDSTVRKVLLPPPSSQSAKVGNTTSKIFPRSSSNDSFGASGNSSRPSNVQQSQTTTTTSTATNQARKFFKTKSHSTSSFEDGKSTIPNDKTSNPSTLTGLKMNNSRETKTSTNSVSIANQRQTIKTGNPRANNAWENKNGGNDNHSSHVNTFDRNERREDGGRLRINNDSAQQQREIKDTATGSQYTTMCTPEEIEKKRMEAKMKLEAKRKMQARSKSAGLLTNGATNATKR